MPQKSSDVIGYPTGLFHELRLCYEKLRRIADTALGPLKLNLREASALAISCHSRLSQVHLATRLELHPNAIVKIVDTLQRRGYVKRERNPENRREYVVVCTQKGKEMSQVADGALARIERQLLHTISHSDQAAFIRTLRVLSKTKPRI